MASWFYRAAVSMHAMVENYGDVLNLAHEAGVFVFATKASPSEQSKCDARDVRLIFAPFWLVASKVLLGTTKHH